MIKHSVRQSNPSQRLLLLFSVHEITRLVSVKESKGILSNVLCGILYGKKSFDNVLCDLTAYVENSSHKIFCMCFKTYLQLQYSI